MRIAELSPLLLTALLLGCPSAIAPEGKHETACFEDCQARAKKCDEDQCARGCRFVIDRLVEHEGTNVVSCLAAASACDDPAWADCAAKIGTHIDGGPPAPPPPHNPDDDDTASE